MEPQAARRPRELVEVLLTIGRLRRTGILTVQGDQQIIGLTFFDGEIVSADALNESHAEGLGSVLASRDLVSPEDFAALVSEYESGGGQVTDMLIERNHIDRQQLMDAQRWHIYDLCREVLGWEDPEYKFYAGSEVARDEAMQPLAAEEVLVRVAEDVGPDGPLPGSMPVAEAIFQKTDLEEVLAGQDELLLGLATSDSEGGTKLLNEIDGRRTVAELAADSDLTEYEARLTLYLLERAGQVRVADDGTGEFLPRAGRKAAARVAEAGASVAQVGVKWLEKGRISSDRLKGFEIPEIEWQTWPARILGIASFVLLVLLMLTDPGRFLLPFPWQEGTLQGVLDEQTSAAYLKIDRAAKTSFLLDGHFPAALAELVSDDYLTPRDLVDPVGRRLGYASQVAGYLIYPEDERDVAPGASRTETVTGNFLLDPEFVPEKEVQKPPLVLLD